jgi:hypothetical protein
MTTFVIPSEVFPVTMRATGHGISAGIGKFGAFIGVFLFPVLETSLGLRGRLLLTAGVGAGLRADLGPARDVPDQPGRYSQRPPGISLKETAINTDDPNTPPLLVADHASAPLEVADQASAL